MKGNVARGIVLMVVAWGAVTTALVLLASDTPETVREPAAVTEPAGGHGPPVEAMRTLHVSISGEEGVSRPGEALEAALIQGEVGIGPMMATVLTDEDCAPDGQGISHCRNDLRLPDGSAVAVRHRHDMTEVPCLSPGEQVIVVPA